MSIAEVSTYTNIGLEGHEVHIEVDANKSLPSLDIIGLPDASIKEAKERIRMTFKNVGVQLPPRKIVVNLAPSHLRKVGTRFDLPMAVAIFRLLHPFSSQASEIVDRSLFFGELGLDGSVKKVTGLLPSIISAYKKGWKTFFVPQENIKELSYIPGIVLYPLTNFLQFFNFSQDIQAIHSIEGAKEGFLQKIDNLSYSVNFSDVKGHGVLKRALSIAASGMHNVLLVGPPGSGKTMLSKALQSILPPLRFKEVIQVSQIYSLVGGLTEEEPMIIKRPFRTVHHTASKVSIVGGGKHMKPGEISLAHLGILFFDELPEFPREVLEVLRQPLEDKQITISRAQGSVQYPADFMFVATMNPCKCGFYKDQEKECSCSINDIHRYQSKISGPLLDRFDLILEVPREKIDTLLDTNKQEEQKSIVATVQASWELQQKRYQGTPYSTNAQLDVKAIDQYISLGSAEQKFLKQAVASLHVSPRVIHRTMKVARTIADIEGREKVETRHLAEALQYRVKSLFVI